MQPSLFIVFLLLSCGNTARVNRRTQFSSSSQTSCRVLAKWICKPETFAANRGQVEECCRAEDVGNEDLRKACCNLAGLPVEKESVAESQKPVAKPPVENPSQVADVDDGITAEVIQEPLETVLSPTLEATLAPIWQNMYIAPDPEKQLVQAFHAEEQKAGLSWEMSCIADCADTCDSAGGDCRAIQSEDDCKKAAKDLGKGNMIRISLARDQDKYPKGCLVLRSGPQVRWNPPSNFKPIVKTNNVCGCYTDK